MTDWRITAFGKARTWAQVTYCYFIVIVFIIERIFHLTQHANRFVYNHIVAVANLLSFS